MSWFTQKIQTLFNQWLKNRIPPNQEIQLGQRQLFIFSTRSGWMFALVLMLLLIGATNYQNSMVFFLSFFLMALGLLSIFFTYANVSGLKLRALNASAVFAGESARFPLLLESHRGCFSLGLGFNRQLQIWIDCLPQKSLTIELAYKTSSRGWNRPGRLTLNSEYPLGLLHCWSHLDLKQKVLAYPKPISPEGRLLQMDEEEGEKAHHVLPGEDYQESARYQAGDPLPHIDWRVYARTDELYTKRFEQHQSETEWIDWDAFQGVEKELRLSYLCYQILQRDREQKNYGLKMPHQTIQASLGSNHLQQCLTVLALFP